MSSSAGYGAKIESVSVNRRKKAFEIHIGSDVLVYAFSRADPRPSTQDPVRSVRVYDMLGGEIRYMLASGRMGVVHLEEVVHDNRDPDHHRRVLLNQLTLEARNRVWTGSRSKREITRRLGTSASQLSRLLDPRNERKSLDRMMELLYALDCELEIVVRARND